MPSSGIEARQGMNLDASLDLGYLLRHFPSYRAFNFGGEILVSSAGLKALCGHSLNLWFLFFVFLKRFN